MIVGGIPFYLRYFKKGMSLSQNVDNLFYAEGAKLRFEFDRLFSSVFSNPGIVKAIVTFLYTKNAGYEMQLIEIFISCFVSKQNTENTGIVSGVFRR